MFYFFAIASMLSYALQQTLLVHHARRIDGLSLAFYRNIGFFVTLLPLLIGVRIAELQVIYSHWILLTFSGIAGALYLALNYGSFRFLPMGLVAGFSIAVSTLCIALFGWIFLHESLSPLSIFLICVIVAGAISLGFQHTHLPHLDNRFALGILLVVISAIPGAFVRYALTVLSRETSPLVSGYFWETSIGIACIFLLLLRSMATRQHLQRIDMRTFLIIAACSAPSLLGTGFFGLALHGGPLAIVVAIGSGSLVVTALLAWAWYGEKLGRGQWASMVMILAGIVALKFV